MAIMNGKIEPKQYQSFIVSKNGRLVTVVYYTKTKPMTEEEVREELIKVYWYPSAITVRKEYYEKL
jgi:hypothetical protein